MTSDGKNFREAASRFVCFVREMPRLSANLARDLHGSFSPVAPRRSLSLVSPSSASSFFLAVCGAAVVRGDGADRENHATRRRDEIDSRRDAGEYSRERRSTKHDWRKRDEGGGKSSRQVIERCAPLSFAVAKSSGSRERSCARNEESRSRIRASIVDEHPRCSRTTKCLVQGNFEKLKQ